MRTLGHAVFFAAMLLSAACAVRNDHGERPARSPITVHEGPRDERWDQARGRYNRVYGTPGQTIYVDKPSAFLMECVRDMPRSGGLPRTAVDIGAGQGRNSFPLAEVGYAVTAIDLSRVGLAHVREVADSRKLRIETIEADVHVVEFEPESIDLAMAMYFHLTENLIKRVQTAIRPGGAIVVEGYTGDAQPGDVPLPERFPGWKIVKYKIADVVPDWFWGGERRPAKVVQFFAVKPGG